LSSKVPIDYVDLRVFAHATEDPDKVLASARNLIPPESVDTVAFTKTPLTGHHGNTIILLETRIKEKKTAQQVMEKLSAGLSIMDKESLNSEIDQHLEKANLYLRLDKQSAYLNEPKLGTTDPIHLRIHFRKHRQEEIMEICRKLGLLP
jgi:RNA binding exosome subunit